MSLAATMLFAACSDDDILREDLPDGTEELAGDIYIRFRLNLSNDGIPGRASALSRADGNVEPADTTPGTDRENAITSVDILVYDHDTDVLCDIVTLNKTEDLDAIKGGTGVVVPIYVRDRHKVRVYAAVNLTDRMRRRFAIGQTGNAASISSGFNDYQSVINEFVPGSNGHQLLLEDSKGSIPMTGQFLVSPTGEPVININPKAHNTKETALPVTAYVSRIVAKVHVLVENAAGHDGYAKAEDRSATPDDKDEYATWMGWIRLENVRYMPNGVNKSSFIFPQPNTAGGQYPWRDLNMDLTSYNTSGGIDAVLCANDFVYYDGMGMYKETIADGHLANAEKYIEKRMNATTGGEADGDRYTQGMYCPENYFNPLGPGVDDGFIKQYGDLVPMITHLSIAAKLTPRSLVVVKNYVEEMNKLVNEFEDNPEKFYKNHVIAKEDFDESDVECWNDIKTNIFDKDPDNIYRDEFRIITADSQDHADYIIKWSLIFNGKWINDPEHDGADGKYPPSTFFVYDTHFDGEQASEATWTQRYLYLTAGAVAGATNEKNKKIKTYSVPHIGGWGYYYTYLDQLGLTDKGSTPYAASQVTRNTYYLVTVGNFGVPGGTTTHPSYIKVNTQSVAWDYVARGDIDLH